MVFRLCFPENSANFIGKHLCWSLFLIKLQAGRPATLLKRDSNTGFFLWNLPNFLENLIWRNTFFMQNTSNGCFWKFHHRCSTNFCRSSHSQMFFKRGALKNFAILTGKHQCWRLFLINLYCNFIKKRLQHRYFLVNIAKFLRTVFYRTLPVAVSGFKHL